MKLCHKCDLDFPDTYKFCRACGGALIKVQPPDNEITPPCPNCTAPMNAECQFCRECGTEFARPAAKALVTTRLVSAMASGPESNWMPPSTASLPSFQQTDRWQKERTNTTSSFVTLAKPAWRKWLLSIAAAVVVLLALAAVVLGVSYWRSPEPPVIAKSRTTPSPAGSPTPSLATPPEGMIYVPRGNFKMGRDDGDEYERPAHEVSVAPFYIDKFEVSRAAYQEFIDATHYPAPTGWPRQRYPENTARFPVTGVSWADANAYAQWTGKRLPTEEEWEYAARGQDNRLYPWGNEWKPNAANAASTGRAEVAEVGSYPAGASPFGVLDMVGNVWEWTASQLHAYAGSSIKEDKLPEAKRRNLKVIRGGCYLNKTGATTTFRMGWDVQQATDYAQTGFRCAQDIRK